MAWFACARRSPQPKRSPKWRSTRCISLCPADISRPRESRHDPPSWIPPRASPAGCRTGHRRGARDSTARDRQVLHSIGQIFYVDGERVGRPEGFEGAILALDMLILHTKSNHVRNSIKLVAACPWPLTDVAFSGLCSALAVLTPEQKEGGVLVIDLAAASRNTGLRGRDLCRRGRPGTRRRPCHQRHCARVQYSRGQAERLKKESGCATTDEAARGSVSRFSRKSATRAGP